MFGCTSLHRLHGHLGSPGQNQKAGRDGGRCEQCGYYVDQCVGWRQIWEACMKCSGCLNKIEFINILSYTFIKCNHKCGTLKSLLRNIDVRDTLPGA